MSDNLLDTTVCSAVQLFKNQKFGSIRVIMRDGEPWFVAKDVCEALGLSDTSKACERLDDDEKGTNTIRTLGGMQEMTVISEPGLYSLVGSSKKPEAKAFKRWVTHEVLPSIRKTGSYSVQPQPVPPPSYMIENSIERAERWIEEEKARLALASELSDTRLELQDTAKELDETQEALEDEIAQHAEDNERLGTERDKAVQDRMLFASRRDAKSTSLVNGMKATMQNYRHVERQNAYERTCRNDFYTTERIMSVGWFLRMFKASIRYSWYGGNPDWRKNITCLKTNLSRKLNELVVDFLYQNVTGENPASGEVEVAPKSVIKTLYQVWRRSKEKGTDMELTDVTSPYAESFLSQIGRNVRVMGTYEYDRKDGSGAVGVNLGYAYDLVALAIKWLPYSPCTSHLREDYTVDDLREAIAAVAHDSYELYETVPSVAEMM